MPKAWLTIPAARNADESTVDAWLERGYGVAVFRDEGAPLIACDIMESGTYLGYACAVNSLIKTVLRFDHECLFCIATGDDTLPAGRPPGEIADEITEHFGGTFGICQPTGDRFAGGSIDRICGSPWIGRDFARRMYGGNGPYWPEYRHMFVDEELQEVALKMGVLWQRRDLVHLHRHFARESDSLNSRAVMKPIPAHLVESNSPAHWTKYKNIFTERKRLGFPGHEPI